MPCIKIIDSIKLYIYAADHNPPHFHALIAEFEELIVIKDLSTYSGNLPKKHRNKVIKWASENQDYLLKQWKKMN